MSRRVGVIIPVLLFCLTSLTLGRTYDAGNKILGCVKSYTVKKGESLMEIARRFGLGFNELAEANPEVDPFVPAKGTKLVIPSAWIVPDVPPTATIVINLSELRLYHFYNSGGRRRIATFPVGIGSEGNDTPPGFFRIKEKREAPSWRVPHSVRRERPELPAVVPPGEENPLGSHAIRLSSLSILIHGTNRPWGVGRRVSHGCIRLYPEHIPVLYGRVGVEDRVLILRQPVKIGVKGGRVFMEVHDDPAEKEYLGHVGHLLESSDLIHTISVQKLLRAVKEKRGYPVDITREDRDAAKK